MIKEYRRLLAPFALLLAMMVGFTHPLISSVAAQKHQKSSQDKADKKEMAPGAPVLWHDPGAVESLDFVGGPGGKENAPRPPFTFLDEIKSGSNPKVHVSDANGVKWSVKFGQEVNAETFSTRMAWASGYFVEPAYFIANGVIEKVKNLGRARSSIKSDGSFHNARFEMSKGKGVKEFKDEQSWNWIANPFANSKELSGLKIIVMLTSNWDNKDVRDVSRGSNTAIFRTKTNSGGEDRFLITDWGASMGKWGGVMGRGKWDCKGFRDQSKDFVKGVKSEIVQFGYSGQHTDDFKSGIRQSDVRWLLQYLGRITNEQLVAGLQASGATPEEVDCFTQALRNRINQLKQVAQ